MAFSLTKYGQREVGLAAVIVTVLGLAIVLLAWTFAMALLALLLPLAAVWAWVLWFFRDPQRDTPAGEGLFISPADGTVTDITPVGRDSVLGCEGIKVGIFMSVFSVHVNRSPEAAVVRRVDHLKGCFLDARDPASSERNESATIHLELDEPGRGVFVIRQIAGLVARRIVTDLAEGQKLARGERIGMIKFGSRMELLVPRELVGEVRVRIGQAVHAGLTVLIARAAATSARNESPTA